MTQTRDDRYHTWLLIQEKPNPLMQKILEEWRYQGKVDMVPRVPVFLGCKGNEPFLYTADGEKFIDEIYQNKNKKIRAFSFASYSELKQLDKKVFSCKGGRLLKVLWDGATKNHEAQLDPYFRRFITLQYLESMPQKDLDNTRLTLFKVNDSGFASNSKDHPRLVLRPERITLPKKCFDRIFLHKGEPLKPQELNSIILPPVRSSFPQNTYYDSIRVQLRKQLHSLIAQYSPTSEPAIVTIWKLMNDPLIRDILVDGGNITLEDRKDSSTSLLLSFFCNKQETRFTETNWFRQTIFLNSKKFIPQQWAQPLGDVLLDDLSQVANQMIHFCATGKKVSWEIKSCNSSGSGSRNGTWEYFNAIKKILKHNEGNAEFDELVTFPSRAKTHPYSNPDNEMAEKLFCMNLFRCPWEEDLGYDWKNAMLVIIEEIAQQQCLESWERIDCWAKTNKDEALTIESRKAGSLKISYSPFVKAEDEVHWRLLLPLGTIFSPRAAIKLNEPTARLDKGFHLAN